MAKTNRRIKTDVVRVVVYDENDRRKNSRGHLVKLKSSITLDKALFKALHIITGNATDWIKQQYLIVKKNKLAKRAGFSRVVQRKAIQILAQYISRDN